MSRQFLAIEIGGTKLQLFVGDATGCILHRWRLEVNAAQGGEGIRAQIENALPEILAAHDVSAVGVGYGGPVDWQTGKICRSHQIEGWADFPLGDWLHEHTGKPVVIDNDANVGTLGETQTEALPYWTAAPFRSATAIFSQQTGQALATSVPIRYF